MKAFVYCLLLLAAPTVRAQKNTIDLLCCDPGRWHDARECRGCGEYNGSAVMCHGADTSVRYVEIRVPQSFIKLDKVKLKVHIQPVHGKGVRFKVTSIERNSLGALVTQFGINAQTVDGSKPGEKYYVKYRIKGQ